MKRVCQMFPTFSRKFIIRFFDLVNCLILLHRIFIIYAFNKLLRNISEIFCKYFAIQEKLYRLKETVNHFITSLKFQQLYLSIHQITLLTFFHSSNFSFRTTRTPNNIQNHQYHRFTDHIQQLFSFTPIYISIQLNNWFLWKKWIPPPPSIPLDAFHVREIDLSPPSINQEQAQSRNLEWPALHPRKPPPVAVTLGQGKDARPSLMQLHHFMRARIGSRCTSR